jgi:hypothetical protein
MKSIIFKIFISLYINPRSASFQAKMMLFLFCVFDVRNMGVWEAQFIPPDRGIGDRSLLKPTFRIDSGENDVYSCFAVW